ncbi:MAG: hypothetical protein CL608_26105 [Anaerolineaceae bacterium]|nr:hypothetical protein [Anaerolineaceae bacterium]
MLETLEAIPNAQTALPELEWQALGQQLVQELARLGNLPRYHATLIGSGIIVQGDNNTVVGPGGVIVQGSVQGDLVMGSQTKQILDPEKMVPQALRRAASRLWNSSIGTNSWCCWVTPAAAKAPLLTSWRSVWRVRCKEIEAAPAIMVALPCPTSHG